MASSDALPLQIKVNEEYNKFHARLLSKESSTTNPSFRVYYTAASRAVPFHWESQPGKPKAEPPPESKLPPLTPPPSYLSNHKQSNSTITKHSKNNAKLFKNIFSKKKCLSSSSSSSSSPSSSSGRSRSSCDEDDEEEPETARGCGGSPTSTLCFGGLAVGGLRRFNSVVFVKSALLAVVGHGSRQGGRVPLAAYL
ncbi:hypothetical protein QJS10_CPB20g00152 [Acorus calamus]|uniref:Uncharacterized protein n=1 Tax=Acorus calamus TaxID=4465 RepID=A0AAV9CCM1_ACOCL|nr:hypothetical protein QJS10_CPB20g00152 [Acorus calamus]